jgi:hypothetical protein
VGRWLYQSIYGALGAMGEDGVLPVYREQFKTAIDIVHRKNFGILILSGTLMQMVDYIHANPVRRGWVDRAVDWPWSSASWYEKHEGVLEIDPIP